MTFLLMLLIGWLSWCVWRMRDRIDSLEKNLHAATLSAVSSAQWHELVERVRRLESGAIPVAESPAEVQPDVTPSSDTTFAEEQIISAPSIASVSTPVSQPLLEVADEPSLLDRLRSRLSSQEWELLVGGNILNKLGALVLVIGIALFLGYSFGHVTAAGRATIAGLTSTASLCAGIHLERKNRYRIFGRGLMGAGWAALYATSYAIYAVPAARVIGDPFAGSIGVLAVATAMIWHSLRYHSQAVTGVAYFAAFAALAVTPSSPFALLGLIPLAASVLYLAWRFEWHPMALFGLAATYLTCISRGSSGASLASTQSLFLAYWLLFEAFDLLRVRRHLIDGGLDLLFPLNTLCFLSLSYFAWVHHAPSQLWVASAFGAVLFLADSLVRALARPLSTFPDGVALKTRLRAGSYEGAFFVSALLAGLSVVGRVPGVWTGIGLALEAEVIYLAGLRLRSSFLRQLGSRAFVFSLWKTLGNGDAPFQTSLLGTHAIWNLTPPMLFHAVLFYVNRGLRQPNVAMSSCAALIVAVLLAIELPIAFLGTAWISFGLLLLEIGLRRKLVEFRVQAWLLLAGGVVATAIGITRGGVWMSHAFSLALIYGCAVRTKWIEEGGGKERARFAAGMSAATTILAALFAWRIAPSEYLPLAWFAIAVMFLELGSRRLPSELRVWFGPLTLLAGGAVAMGLSAVSKFPATSVWVTYLGMCLGSVVAVIRLTLFPTAETMGWERSFLRDIAAGIACAAGLITAWMVIPDPEVTIAWTALAVASFEAAIKLHVKSFRVIALAALFTVYVRVLAFDLVPAGFHPAVLSAVFVAMAGMYWTLYRSSGLPNRGDLDWIVRVQFWAPLVPILVCIEREAGLHHAPLGWALLAVTLVIVGIRSGIREARLQSYAVAGLAFMGAMCLNTYPPRLFLCGMIAAIFYTSQYLEKRFPPEKLEWTAAYFSLLGTLLVGALLYGQASGGMLTVSWGIQGSVLLAFGFALRERLLRLQGLGMLLLCILKLFLYDLRNLETIYRILSFVVLGLILLGVSWIYSRFRESVRRIL